MLIRLLLLSALTIQDSLSVLQPKLIKGRDGRSYLPFYAKEFPYSNHYITKIYMDKQLFMSTEQYYFYRKAQIFGDKIAETKLLTETNPMKAKDIGRKVQNVDKNKWDEVSYGIMKRVIFEKFKQHNELKTALLDTKDGILIEASQKDTRWGVGLSINDKRISDPRQWKGTNLLGKALMEVRTGLQHNADERSPDIGLRKKGSDGKFYRVFYSIRSYFHAFYPVEVLFIDNKGFTSAQHYFAYTKAMTFGDSIMARKIREEPSGQNAQSMSFSISNFNQQTWDAISYNVMLKTLKAKFEQNEYLKTALKDTGNDEIVFADTSNMRWSTGLDWNSSEITDPSAWKGENLMGKALVEVRDGL